MIANTVIMLIMFGMTESIDAANPENYEERLRRFEAHNSDEGLHKLADNLAIIARSSSCASLASGS